MLLDRRAAIAASAAATGARLTNNAQAQASAPPVARTLAHYITQARFEDLPANVRREGCRTLLNYVGVAVGGSRHETVDQF
jgi:hypothetical protein